MFQVRWTPLNTKQAESVFDVEEEIKKFRSNLKNFHKNDIIYMCVHEIKIIKTLRHRIEKSELCSQLRFKSFIVFTTTSNNFVLLRLHVVHINSISHQIHHNITDFIHATQYQLSAQLQHSTSSKVVFWIKSIKEKRSQPAGKEAREFARESSFNKIL